MIKIELSFAGVARFALALLLILGLVLMRDVVVLLFISYIVMLALFPLVNWFGKKGVPRVVSVVGVVLILVLFLVVLLTFVLRLLVGQIDAFFDALPNVLSQVVVSLRIDQYLDVANLLQTVQNFVARSWLDSLTTSVQVIRVSTGVIANLIWILVFTVYLIVEREKVKRFFVVLIPVDNKEELAQIIDEVDKKLGAWLRSQVVLMFFIGSLTFIWLTVLGVPYAGALAVIAGLLEIVPILGPAIATFVMAAVGLTLSPIIAVTILVISFIQQQIENDWLIPRLMKENVGLDPLITIIAIVVGGRIGGMVGTILAIPTLAIIMIIYQRYVLLRPKK